MFKIRGLRALALNGSLLTVLMSGDALAQARTHHEDHVLGTSLDMKAAGPASAWNVAIAAARAEMLRLDAVLSAWRPDSELAALNASGSFHASPDLFAVIAQAERLRAATRGAFSPRLGGPISLWRGGAGVDEPALQQAIAEAEHGSVRLSPFGRMIEKDRAIQFDLDAIAKGHVLDRALLAARRAAPSLRGIMIDIGGDIAVWGEGGSDGSGARSGDGVWRVGVARPGDRADNSAPLHLAYLRNQAIATSGRGARHLVTKNGVANHIISPQTGAPAGAVLQASVIAPNARLADALATAFSVMNPAESLALADSIPGVAAFIAAAKGDQHFSGRWTTYAEIDARACEAPAMPGAKMSWPRGFAVDVDFEIPRAKESDAKRPYVSIWVSDEKKKLVRTLLVLGDRARWRESNYIWWRRFERLTPEAVQAISRPTREPGKYNVSWDGTDDAGQMVGQGKYILNIEVSREHGSHGFQAIPLDIGANGFDASADPAPEINTTRARFGLAK